MRPLPLINRTKNTKPLNKPQPVLSLFFPLAYIYFLTELLAIAPFFKSCSPPSTAVSSYLFLAVVYTQSDADEGVLGVDEGGVV